VSTPTVGRMLRSSARRPIVSVLAAVLALGVVTGCSEDEKAAPDPAPTPIASLNTVEMELPRIEFCQLVSDSAVEDAIGGKPTSDSSYGNGEEVEVTGAGNDVVHEIGCSWTGDKGSTARAWVFARPVSPDFARSVIASGKKTEGCRTIAGPPYGKPAVTQLCRLAGGEQRLRHAGLFGQTWLTCDLAATEVDQADLRDRADAWCSEVANALNTAR
jgi:hypothetical protein